MELHMRHRGRSRPRRARFAAVPTRPLSYEVVRAHCGLPPGLQLRLAPLASCAPSSAVLLCPLGFQARAFACVECSTLQKIQVFKFDSGGVGLW